MRIGGLLKGKDFFTYNFAVPKRRRDGEEERKEVSVAFSYK